MGFFEYILNTVEKPTIFVGDFNNITSQHEKVGRSAYAEPSNGDFCGAVNSLNWWTLGFLSNLSPGQTIELVWLI